MQAKPGYWIQQQKQLRWQIPRKRGKRGDGDVGDGDSTYSTNIASATSARHGTEEIHAGMPCGQSEVVGRQSATASPFPSGPRPKCARRRERASKTEDRRESGNAVKGIPASSHGYGAETWAEAWAEAWVAVPVSRAKRG
ncbi:hypothetical protein EG329_003160 [Mollisiaceae sp. DMI_Dod_QoI]|nr:hypothetical protein EG329_003160 [Helotiales sp. DMI_Dod_QoI]